MLHLFSICLSKTSTIRNCKRNFNTAIVPSYFYDGTLDYWICFLIYFILSLSSMSDLLTLSLWIALNSHSLSLCAGGWAFTSVCGSWVSGSVDRQVWSSGFFFFCCDKCLKEEMGMAKVGRGSLKSVVAKFCWSLEIVGVWIQFCWVFVGHLWVLFWQWWLMAVRPFLYNLWFE